MQPYADWFACLRAPAAIAAVAALAACAGQTHSPAANGPVANADAEAAASSAAPPAALRDFDMALAALRAGDLAQAELGFEHLALQHPGYPGPHVNLAIIYMQDGRDDDAESALNAALAIEPGHAAANNQLGILKRRQGRFDEAEAAYRRALETNPGYALAHYNLGVLLDLYIERPREALQHYERYQALTDDSNRRVAGWIVDLRRRLGINDSETAGVFPAEGL